MLRRLVYFGEKALGSVRESPGISLLTAGTIGTALVMLGVYAMCLQNLEGLALIWGRTAALAVYLDDDLPAARWPEIRDAVASHAGVARVRLVTPEEALIHFRARGPEAAALVEGVTSALLPASLAIDLQGGFADLSAVARLAGELREIAGVAEVDYGQQEFQRLRILLDLLRVVGIAAGVLVALATAFIVSNTIRLTVYARRDEISILRLVGATAWFVRTPFLLEGALWGFGGGALAAATLWLGEVFLAPRLTQAVADMVGGLVVHLYAADVGLAILVAGTLFGVLGSALAVGRFLDVPVA